MEMGEITSVGCANRRDLLAAFHGLARMHQHLLHVPIIGFHIFPLTIFEIRVQ